MKNAVLWIVSVAGSGFFAAALNNGLFGDVYVSPAAWLGGGGLAVAGCLVGEMARVLTPTRPTRRRSRQRSALAAVLTKRAAR